MFFKRDISDEICRMARTFPVLVLTGARQTGKTTLLRELFPKHRYFSLDLPSDAEKAERDPELFLREHPAPLLIDEVQYAPALLRHLKPVVDRDRHRMEQFILTGSQKFSLMKGVSESLAGRIGVASLEGLSRHEMSSASEAPPTDVEGILHYLQRGSFPELWRNSELRAEDFFRSYLATYLERDIRQITRVGSLRDFERFIRITAARNAQPLNKSDIAKDVGIAPRTANEWLSVLETSNQISLLEPYFENTGKRVIKSPKLYWNDTGLLAFLTGLGEGVAGNSPLIGALWESAIYAELRKLNAASGGTRTLWFYRDNEGREVDFLLVGQGRIHFLEAKWGENVDTRAAKPLRETAALLKSRSLLETGCLWVVARPASSYPLAGRDVEVHGLGDLPSLFGL
jgi:predicted AAA+ superfamily ATPase